MAALQVEQPRRLVRRAARPLDAGPGNACACTADDPADLPSQRWLATHGIVVLEPPCALRWT